MSHSVEEANFPSHAVSEERCQRFAEMTGTDTALATFYLKNRDWDLDRSVKAFYEDKEGSKKTLTAAVGDTCKEEKEESSPLDPEPNGIRLMSWNIDGLDSNNIHTRTNVVCQTIKKKNPAVVFLQEVIPETLDILRTECPEYQILPGGQQAYFTAMLIKEGVVVLEDHDVQMFYNSRMGRNLLSAKCHVKGVPCFLMTSHLESTTEQFRVRKNQLRRAVAVMRSADKHRTSIFGGDLNSRDKECHVKGVPCFLMTSHLESTTEQFRVRKNQLRRAVAVMRSADKHRTSIFGGDLNSRDKECHVKGVPCFLMTSHLESTTEQFRVRKNQLRRAVAVMRSADKHRTSIFGGDLNSRDKECHVKGVPCFLMTSHLESTTEQFRVRKNQLRRAVAVMRSADKHRTSIFGGDLNSRDKECHVKGVPCFLMTSHLESTTEQFRVRKNQLRRAVAVMRSADKHRTSIFGGDLNSRDKELAQIGGLPDDVLDLWEVTGKRPEAEFTWDTRQNDNLSMPFNVKPFKRFDRLYLRHAQPKPKLKPVYFELIGTERIPTCERFPSDHWGILVHFDIIQ